MGRLVVVLFSLSFVLACSQWDGAKQEEGSIEIEYAGDLSKRERSLANIRKKIYNGKTVKSSPASRSGYQVKAPESESK